MEKGSFTRQLFVRVRSCGLANFLRELGYTMTACLKEDASACIGMATRRGPCRLKHVEIKHFALQHWVRQGRLNLDKVTTTERLADIMTKAPKIGLTKCVTDHSTREFEQMDRRCSQDSHINFNDHLRCDVSVVNLTSFRYFASGTCRYFLNSWHVGCCAS